MKKQLFISFLIFSLFKGNISTQHSEDFYIKLEKEAIEFNAEIQKKVLPLLNQYAITLKSVSNINEFKNWITSLEHDINILHQEHDVFIQAHENIYIPAIDYLKAVQEQIKDVIDELGIDSLQQMPDQEFEVWLIQFKNIFLR